MLRSKQYLKLYKKYHSLKLDQSDMDWFVATRAYNQMCVIKLIPELKAYFKGRRLHEKGM